MFHIKQTDDRRSFRDEPFAHVTTSAAFFECRFKFVSIQRPVVVSVQKVANLFNFELVEDGREKEIVRD